MTAFKVGEWIIATKPMMVESSGFGFTTMMGRTLVPDRAYMHRPIKVVAVTEAHIVYNHGNDKGAIMPIHELEERGFIVAAPELVETVAERS